VLANIYPENLVAHYRFETMTGTVLKDFSGKKNHGRIQGENFSWHDEGVEGGCGYFRENASVLVESTPLLSIMTEMTISLWIKPETLEGRQVLLSKRLDPHAKYYYYLALDDGRPFGAVGMGNDFGFIPRSRKIPSGKWSHIVMTLRMNGDLSLYINGKLVEKIDTEILGGFHSRDAQICLCADCQGTRNFFSGWIDEVLILTKSPEEKHIHEEYQLRAEAMKLDQARNNPERFLVAHFPMDEGGGNRIRNEIMPSNPGKLSPGLEGQWRGGFHGSHLHFKGKSDNVLVKPYPALCLNRSFTILCWIRPFAFGDRTRIVFKSDPDPRRFYLIGEHRGILYGGIGNGRLVEWITCEKPIELNKWSQVGLVFDHRTKILSLCKNGEIVEFKDTDAHSSTKNYSLILGGVIGHFFNGYIRGVSLYNVPLPESTLMELYRKNIEEKQETVQSKAQKALLKARALGLLRELNDLNELLGIETEFEVSPGREHESIDELEVLVGQRRKQVKNR
jgi:hypothetical protein